MRKKIHYYVQIDGFTLPVNREAFHRAKDMARSRDRKFEIHEEQAALSKCVFLDILKAGKGAV